MSKIEYPCTKCEDEQKCRHSKKYRKCEPFKKWFHIMWSNIRRLFGVECVELTHEERECDNENS